MIQLILFRGHPGAGKTTLAKRMYPDAVYLDADSYFITADGEYKFCKELLSEVHKRCLTDTKLLLSYYPNTQIVVANTFTRVWEMQPYLDLGYKTLIFKVEGNFQSVHKVPQEVIDRMKENYEPYNGEIIIRNIVQ